MTGHPLIKPLEVVHMASKPAPLPFSPAPVPGTDTPPQAVMPEPKKVKREVPSTPNKVIGAKVILYYQGPDGKVYEASTIVDYNEYKVQKYSLDVDEKHEKKRDPDDRSIVGFEDTGERILKFTMRYHLK